MFSNLIWKLALKKSLAVLDPNTQLPNIALGIFAVLLFLG